MGRILRPSIFPRPGGHWGHDGCDSVPHRAAWFGTARAPMLCGGTASIILARGQGRVVVWRGCGGVEREAPRSDAIGPVTAAKSVEAAGNRRPKLSTDDNWKEML